MYILPIGVDLYNSTVLNYFVDYCKQVICKKWFFENLCQTVLTLFYNYVAETPLIYATIKVIARPSLLQYLVEYWNR